MTEPNVVFDRTIIEDSTVEYRKDKGYKDMPVIHYHTIYEIYYQLSGRRNYFLRDKIYSLQKGDIVLIKPFDVHRSISANSSDYERIILYIDPHYFSKENNCVMDIGLLSFFDKSTGVLRLNEDEQGFVEQLLFKMLKEDSQRKKWYNNYIRFLIAELLIFLERCSEVERFDSSYYQKDFNKKILDIISHINKNYMNDMSLSSIAKVFYIDQSHLARSFKKATGLTCIEYLNNVRIKEACKLLHQAKYKISDISEMTGYKSITHFERMFNKICGCSPSTYRKINF